MSQLEDLQKVLLCGVCSKEPISDPTLLSCNHSFCRACVQSLVDAHPTGEIACPRCNQRTTVPGKLATRLPSDEVKAFLARLMSGEARVPACSEDDNPSVAHCAECSLYLCQEHADEHKSSKRFHEHVLIPVTPEAPTVTVSQEGDGGAGKAAAPSVPPCVDDDKPSVGYCTNCKVHFCQEHVELHKSSKRTHDHSIIEVKPDEQPSTPVVNPSETAAALNNMLHDLSVRVLKCKMEIMQLEEKDPSGKDARTKQVSKLDEDCCKALEAMEIKNKEIVNSLTSQVQKDKESISNLSAQLSDVQKSLDPVITLCGAVDGLSDMQVLEAIGAISTEVERLRKVEEGVDISEAEKKKVPEKATEARLAAASCIPSMSYVFSPNNTSVVPLAFKTSTHWGKQTEGAPFFTDQTFIESISKPDSFVRVSAVRVWSTSTAICGVQTGYTVTKVQDGMVGESTEHWAPQHIISSASGTMKEIKIGESEQITKILLQNNSPLNLLVLEVSGKLNQYGTVLEGKQSYEYAAGVGENILGFKGTIGPNGLWTLGPVIGNAQLGTFHISPLVATQVQNPVDQQTKLYFKFDLSNFGQLNKADLHVDTGYTSYTINCQVVDSEWDLSNISETTPKPLSAVSSFSIDGKGKAKIPLSSVLPQGWATSRNLGDRKHVSLVFTGKPDSFKSTAGYILSPSDPAKRPRLEVTGIVLKPFDFVTGPTGTDQEVTVRQARKQELDRQIAAARPRSPSPDRYETYRIPDDVPEDERYFWRL